MIIISIIKLLLNLKIKFLVKLRLFTQFEDQYPNVCITWKHLIAFTLRLPSQIYYYSLRKNNAISKKINFKPKFWINYRPFTSVVLCTQTPHQQWLLTRACYKKHRSAKIMVIKIELKIVDQIGTSVMQFLAKKVNCWNFEGDCVPNGSTGKVATWGVPIYSWNMTFSDKIQIFWRNGVYHL